MRNKIIIALISLVACTESTVDPIDVQRGEEFFPLKIGLYFEYQVEQLEYLISGDAVAEDYFLREEVTESFTSGIDSVFVMRRFTRASVDDSWEPFNTWQIRKSSQNVTVSEENTPFIKIVFPIQAGNSWDGNAQNGLDEDVYVMDSLYSVYVLNDVQFDSTLTVIQNDNQDFIVEQDRRFEIYGFGIGLVYREEQLLQYCTDDDCLGQQIIETGNVYRQRLMDYGEI